MKEKWNDSGPIQPKHLREAARKMKAKGLVPHSIARKNPLHWNCHWYNTPNGNNDILDIIIHDLQIILYL